jgi:hypothetical protein
MVHPGSVATKLSGWNFDDNLIECCTSLVSPIGGLTMERMGYFIDLMGSRERFEHITEGQLKKKRSRASRHRLSTSN